MVDAGLPYPSPVQGYVSSHLGGWVSGTAGFVLTDEGVRFTEDAGRSWSEPRPLPPDAVADEAPMVEFVDTRHGSARTLIEGRGQATLEIAQTADGGRTWARTQVAETALPGPDAYAVVEPHFTETQHGVALATLGDAYEDPKTRGEVVCVAYWTDDGGASWMGGTDRPCLAPMGRDWSSPAIGFGPLLSRDWSTPTIEHGLTLDGGRAWTTFTLDPPADHAVFEPMYVERTDGGVLRMVAAGRASDEVGVATDLLPLAALSSVDAGRTWQEIARLDGYGAWTVDVDGLGGDHWIAHLTGRYPDPAVLLIETRDAGRSWTVVPASGLPLAHDQEGTGSMAWTDARHGMLNGYLAAGTTGFGSFLGNTVFLTDDGGRTWHQVPF